MALAKTTRPRVAGVVVRPRLFRRLDRAATRPLTWVWGPPGAGKTALVASYLAARRLPGLWYQLDAGDADVASFFFYLGRAAPPRRTALPLLTAEYARGLRTFAQRFFRSLYARSRPPFAVVFDNYQDVPPASAFHGLFVEAARQLPSGGRVIVLSRGAPPAPFARLRAERAVEVVGWPELRLTAVETARFARRVGGGATSGRAARTLYLRTDGWAAGVVLLLERGQAADETPRGRRGREALFDYFAGEVFDRAEAVTQSVLLATALLPRVTPAVAEALTGEPDAPRILDELHRQNYFTTLHAGEPPSYQYHPLFREFLLARGRETYPPERRAELQSRAAKLLQARGQTEEAAELLQNAGDWSELGRLVRREASLLAGQGRIQTVERWIRSIPATIVRDDPWLSYWLAVCRLSQDPPESLGHIERAFTRFKAEGDRAGMLLACAGAMDATMFQWRDLTRLDPWIAAVETLWAEPGTDPPPAIAARLATSMFMALAWRQPQHPEIERWAERAEALTSDVGDLSSRVATGWLRATYSLWVGVPSRAHEVIASLRPIFRSRDAMPAWRILGITAEASYWWRMGEAADALRTVIEGLEIARRTGVHIHDSLFLAHAIYALLTAGDVAAAGPWLRRLAGESRRTHDVALHNYLSAWDAVLRRDWAGALARIEAALKSALQNGAQMLIAQCHLGAAQVRHELGQPELAAAALADVRRIADEMRSYALEHMCLVAEAQFALDQGDQHGALERLRGAMRLGRQQGLLVFAFWRRDVMARLCERALEAGIETEYVRQLIQRSRLVPEHPLVDMEAWPWPVRIYTLGRFAIERDGRPVEFAGKAPKRSLALLQAVIALGGPTVAEVRLAETLWPDADGDAAALALTTAIHRLRRLLGRDEAVRRQGGRLGLDPRHCWVDVWALERLLDEAEAAGAGTVRGRERAMRAAALYRGAFLEGESEVPGAAARGERLRRRLGRALAAGGAALAAAGDWAGAAGAYERALEMDAADEGITRQLITAYRQLGEPAKALAAYRRCREALATLGMEPTTETQTLARSVGLRRGAAS